MTATPVQARPPRSWEVQTLAVMVTISAAALLDMLLLVADLVLRSFVLNGRGPMSGLVKVMLGDPYTIGLLGLVLLVAYVGGFFWWRSRTRALLKRDGDGDAAAARHWGVTAWSVVLIGSIALRVALRTDAVDSLESMVTALELKALLQGVRLVALALLLFAVWRIREQVRAAVARSGASFGNAD